MPTQASLFQTSLIQYQIKYTNPWAPDFYLDPHQIPRLIDTSPFFSITIHAIFPEKHSILQHKSVYVNILDLSLYLDSQQMLMGSILGQDPSSMQLLWKSI